MPYYFMNLAGFNLDDEKIKQINHPYAEILTHVTLKTTEVGALVGTGVVGPLLCYQEGITDHPTIRKRMFECGMQGFFAGMVLGPVLVRARLRTKSPVSIYDRAYRLRWNKNQCRVERLTLLGSLVGLGVAQYTGESLSQGALFGFCAGNVAAGVLNYVMDTAMKLESAI